MMPAILIVLILFIPLAPPGELCQGPCELDLDGTPERLALSCPTGCTALLTNDHGFFELACYAASHFTVKWTGGPPPEGINCFFQFDGAWPSQWNGTTHYSFQSDDAGQLFATHQEK